MALSGKLLADFSEFQTACANAETKLVSFETGAGKVTTSLERMETSLSGKKLIQDATLAAQAVDNIGGTSKLTEGELQRLSGQASAAADKMRAMGIEVPPGIQKIADAAKDATTQHQSLGSTVRGLATDFLAMFTARAAFTFVKDTVNEASALKDLSQQTHINVEELQLLAGAMSEFGVDADTLGKGLFKLSRGIAGGDESVATGLHLMGMSLKDVEGLNGKELFLKIEGGLATLQGGLRDTAAADLFGGRLGAAMAGASEGIGGALAKWQALNTVASTESVDAMDTFGESIERANKNLSSIAANMIGPLAEGFNTLKDAADKGTSKWAIFWAMTKDAAAASTGLGTGTENLARLLDELNKKTEENAAKNKKAAAAHDAVKAAIDTRTAAEKFMAALEADAAGTLEAAQIKNLEHLKEIGALNAKNAEGIGVNIAQFNKYVASVAAAAKADADWLKAEEAATKLAAASLLELTKLQEQYTVTRTKQTGTATDVEVAAIHARYAVLAAALTKAGTLTAEISAQMAKDMAQDLAGVGSAWTALSNLSQEEMQRQADAALADYDRMIASGLTFSRTVLDAQLQRYRDLQQAASGWGDSGVEAANRVTAAQKTVNEELARTKALADAAAAANRAQGNTLDTATAAQDPEINALLKQGWSLKNAEALKLARQWSFTPKLYDPQGNPETAPSPGERVPGYALGGPVLADGPIFAHAGEYVIPKGGSGGGTVVNATIYVNGTAADVARQVAAELLRTIKQGQQLS